MQTFLASRSDVKKTNCCKFKDEIVSFEVKFDPMAYLPHDHIHWSNKHIT